MGDTEMTVELLQAAGSTGFALIVMGGVYRLTNRSAGEFLEVQRQQAEAMGTLAGNVNQSIENGRDTQTVLRAISAQVDSVKADIAEVRRLVVVNGKPAK